MRPTNEHLCVKFRELLTVEAKQMLDDDVLETTKPWRSKLWKAFEEIEDRMMPLKAMEREKRKK